MMLATAVQHAEGGGMSVPDFLFLLIAILVSAKILGELAERMGQPAVLGELLAGVLLGSSVFGLVDPSVEIVHLLAEIGVVLLLFQIGLETNLGQLLRVGPASSAVAAIGAVVDRRTGRSVPNRRRSPGCMPAISAFIRSLNVKYIGSSVACVISGCTSVGPGRNARPNGRVTRSPRRRW